MPHFIVAGAGIAGLAASLALACRGHRVDVFERRATLDEAGAGLQLAPNATRVLKKLGLLAAVEERALEAQAVRIRRGRDGAPLATLPLGAAARQRYGAPFLLIHRADLQHVLAASAATCSGISLSPGVTLDRFEPHAGTAIPSGTPSGRDRQLHADGLVSAGGLHFSSLARSAVGAPRFSGKTAWRALVAAERVPVAFRRPETNLWLGARTHMVHYPLRGGTLVNVVVIVDEAGGDRVRSGDPWAQPGDPAVLDKFLRGWDSEPRHLVSAAETWRTWPLFDASADTAWSEDRLTRVGDAAHPMLPFLAQGASQAIEDAAALADAVAEVPGDIAAAFRLYEARRRPAALRVQTASRRQGRIYHLSGPAAAARDLTMRLLGPRRMLAGLDWLYADPGRRRGRDEGEPTTLPG